MRRNIYDSIIKFSFNSIGYILSVISSIYFLLALLIDNAINITSVILIISGIGIVLFGLCIRVLLRVFKVNSIIFYDGCIGYKGKKYQNEIRYFSFRISFMDPSMTYPRLLISDGNQNISIYLTKRDVKKLIQKGYCIKNL